MLDHLIVGVADLDASASFYAKTLAPLGITEAARYPGLVGFESNGSTWFWLREENEPGTAHIGFAAGSQEAVDAFHAAAVAAGAQDNGTPGLRPDYGPSYYAAFVHDPDGYNIEAVHKG
jgi:catechol 2,3-dioxygenase-like lactoylglutathione lyase family enzyme